MNWTDIGGRWILGVESDGSQSPCSKDGESTGNMLESSHIESGSNCVCDDRVRLVRMTES